MHSLSSSSNLVSPPPAQRRRATAPLAVSSAAHPITKLPSYIAPICDATSITKHEIISAMAGKKKIKLAHFPAPKIE